VSELIGVIVPVKEEGDYVISRARRTSSRIDPLGILRGVTRTCSMKRPGRGRSGAKTGQGFATEAKRAPRK
jgi:hypothetical protein